MDGWGISKNNKYNALTKAKLPFWKYLLQHHPSSHLQASGEFVGLPKNQMGNSEVGHTNIGSGRIVLQDLPRINKAFKDNEIKTNNIFQNFVSELIKHKSTCHILGLISPGGIHSHQEHIYQIIDIISDLNIPISIHAFLDGRDTAPNSAIQYISSLEKKIKSFPKTSISTMSGRFYAMDRDNRWERIEKSFETIAYGKNFEPKSPTKNIQESYQNNISDEFPIMKRESKQ